jgi:hypothetical protein
MFLFVHLGFPKQHEITGYLAGLFIMSGIKFGILLLMVRLMCLALRQIFAEVGSCASRYHFADMHLTRSTGKGTEPT